jgi:multiple sugar transport system substrate-binding protein
LDFDVMPLPSLGLQRTIADMTGYCIAADTEELGAAADFVAFAVGPEGATITTRPGYVVPSNLAVAHSPAFLQRSEQPEQSFIFNEGVRRTQSLPFSPAWPELAERVEPALGRLFYAPVIDLEELLVEIDALSREVLAPAAE